VLEYIVGFEPSTLESERPQTHASDRAVIVIGSSLVGRCRYSHFFFMAQQPSVGQELLIVEDS